VVPAVGLLAALGALVQAAPADDALPGSSCAAGLQKVVVPQAVAIGQDAEVTMVVTHTCAPARLPMDLVFLIDNSNSMERDRSVGLPTLERPTERTPEDTPDPETPPPPVTPAPPPMPSGVPFLSLPEQVVPSATIDRSTPGTPTRDPGPGPVPPTPTLGMPEKDEEPAGDEDLLPVIREAITDFLSDPDVRQDLDSGKLRVGLVSFNDRARVDVSLTDQASRVTSAFSRLRPQGMTNVGVGLQFAQRELSGRDSQGKAQVIVLFSDGKFDDRALRGVRNQDEIEVVTVAVGRSANEVQLRRLASEPELALGVRDRQELLERYGQELAKFRPVTMTDLALAEGLAPLMRYRPDSAQPLPASVSGGMIEWQLGPPTERMTVTYRVAPEEAGRLPVSTLSEARWTDSEGLTGQAPFPEVFLEVAAVPPTPTASLTPTEPPATPTATATSTALPPTATGTPRPGLVWLPVLVKEAMVRIPTATPEPCHPTVQTVDVALVVDTSGSMLEPTHAGGITKLDAAIEAGGALVELLKLNPSGATDQAALVWFNHQAAVEQVLSNDEAALDAALAQLPNRQADGTRIDLGLLTATGELESERRRAGNNRAIVLVTDGRPSAGAQADDVLAAADVAKAAGITVWTVGLGTDIDADLLRAAATSPAFFKHAPDAAGLRLIYQEIARVVPCP
jgi:Mg-chelatase subunit ChlD